MKVALYQDAGRTQVVLTPESEWERRIVTMLGKETAPTRILHGEFYACQGGWTREHDLALGSGPADNSLLLVLDKSNGGA